MALYAAYGSNCDPAQMLERCPHSPAAGTGWLEGWRLTFGGEDLGWEGALATIVESPGDSTMVVTAPSQPRTSSPANVSRQPSSQPVPIIGEYGQ